MHNTRLVSKRSFKTRMSWHLVYEWEDQLIESLSLPWIRRGRFGFWLRRQLAICGLTRRGKSREFMFQMRAMGPEKGRSGRNTVACVIDYFVPRSQTEAYLRTIRKAPLTLFTSREAYEWLLHNAPADMKPRLGHLPISLPDKYMPAPGQTFDKDIDVLIIGRRSPKMESFLIGYLQDHPDLVIAKRATASRRSGFYTSKNEYIGQADTRQEYLALLRRTKVLLYTTPGYDGEKSTAGFSQVTPRFLEGLACGCRFVLRYPDNADTRWFDLSAFGPSVETTAQFTAELNRAFSAPADMDAYRQYLARHLTSVRAASLATLLRGDNP